MEVYLFLNVINIGYISIMFSIGTMANEINGVIAPNEGALYRIGDTFKPVKEISPVSISNGLAWNMEDSIFYYIDSPTRQVAAYDYDPIDGTICKKLDNLIIKITL